MIFLGKETEMIIKFSVILQRAFPFGNFLFFMNAERGFGWKNWDVEGSLSESKGGIDMQSILKPVPYHVVQRPISHFKASTFSTKCNQNSNGNHSKQLIKGLNFRLTFFHLKKS